MLYTELTKKALKISFEAHKNQLDKSGMPYVYHPFHLAEQMDDEFSTCVALLHDVAEDTDMTVDDLASEGFPPEVTDALLLMTHGDGVPYMDYIKKIKTDPIATKVKLADLEHNSDLTRLDHIDSAALERADKYRRAMLLLRGGSPDEGRGETLKNRIRGSLIGGAAGDALGYAVEFTGEQEIFSRYGYGGIRSYSLDSASKKALISDDTQMTLFTAEAMTKWLSENPCGSSVLPREYALRSYLEWLDTQEKDFGEAADHPNGSREAGSRDLKYERGMYACRAPGITCLSALTKRGDAKKKVKSFIEDKINNSKGCGGVMRVAPAGMLKRGGVDKIDMEGAEIAAITHCHSLGYMSAALLTHIIHGILYSVPEKPLDETVREALATVARLFRDDENIGELVDIIDLAVELSENGDRDLDNIHRLGEGWVAEEALAVAVYCCLRYPYDFSRCIITAVNHKGDSDSTGAIAGNIIGAYLGCDEIEDRWKEDLELSDVILGVADDLYAELMSVGFEE